VTAVKLAPVEKIATMNRHDDSDKIHVMPDGAQWEIENQDGDVLAVEIDLARAIGIAKEFAREQGLGIVILHDPDGVTEEVPAAGA